MERKDELEAQVRKTSLRERLDECRTRIGKMCSEGRPPRMCIPVQWDDDDFYISTTLADAQRALDAERERVKELERDNAAMKQLFDANPSALWGQLATLQAQVTAWRSALMDLTPGGSEYADDPQACVRWAREVRTRQHEAIIDGIKQRKESQAQLRQVREDIKRVECMNEAEMPPEIWTDINGYAARTRFKGGVKYIRATLAAQDAGKEVGNGNS